MIGKGTRLGDTKASESITFFRTCRDILGAAACNRKHNFSIEFKAYIIDLCGEGRHVQQQDALENISERLNPPIVEVKKMSNLCEHFMKKCSLNMRRNQNLRFRTPLQEQLCH